MKRVLPKGAIIVKRDEAKEKQGTLILTVGTPPKPNRGLIVLTGPDLLSFKYSSVVFRENFGETIEIDGEELMYFRDFNSSIYYVEDDKK